MKQLQDQMNAITKAINDLTTYVEKIAEQIETFKISGSMPDTAAYSPNLHKPVKRVTLQRRTYVRRGPRVEKVGSILDVVYAIIRRSRKGVGVATIMDKTGLERRQVSNALYKLVKKNMVETISRGLYIRKK